MTDGIFSLSPTRSDPQPGPTVSGPRQSHPLAQGSEEAMSRRGFVGVAAVGAALALGCARPAGGMARLSASAAENWELYVGTYTAETSSQGIYRLLVDRTTGAQRALAVAAESSNPSFLALSNDGRRLLAVNEVTSFGGAASGALRGFTRDPATGALSRRGEVASRGGAPCYVAMDRSGRWALVANYVGGNVALFPIGAEGAPGAASTVVQHSGRGVHPTRQAGPHAHCMILDPGERFALAADLGIDRILVYDVDLGRGTLTPARVPGVALAPGAGPRHLAFAPDGKTLYVVNELDSTLVVLAYDAETGGVAARQRLSTRPSGATGENFPADLHVHPSGRTVYASNRGDDTIAVFAVDAAGGALTLVQSVPTGGRWPRNFALDPAGTLLVVANQRSDSIVAFHVEAASGRLSPTGEQVAVPAPVCVLFAGPA